MRDLAEIAWRALVAHRLRSVLSFLGIAIGVGSVIVLTSVGEGARQYVVGQFAQFGTNLIAIAPGKVETGGIPGAFGGTTHHLTIADAIELARLPGVDGMVPAVFGVARVEYGGRGRNVTTYGVTPDIQEVWSFKVRQGTFWHGGDPRRGGSETVLGPKVVRELFGEENPLGKLVRISGTRFRVVGVMESKGMLLGFDLDDSVYVPVATAMQMFNLLDLSEIDLSYAQGLTDEITERAKSLLRIRHEGKEDVTVTSQDAMLEMSGNIMNTVTMAVGAIAGISLVVGAIGILTMMWIAVGERRGEIGLVRAIGASRSQVRLLFIWEAAALATAGGLAGITGGLFVCWLLTLFVPGLPVATPVRFVVAALGVSLATGLASGVLPARRAASLDPIEALRAE